MRIPRSRTTKKAPARPGNTGTKLGLWDRLLPLPDNAYARKGQEGSDVEVIETTTGYIECVDCELVEDFFAVWDEDSMVKHMQDHKAAGHHVPATVIPMLRGRA